MTEIRCRLEFFDIQAAAKQMPGQIVLLPESYRPANPTCESAAQEVRATLLHHLSAAALGQIHMTTAMKRVRFWPQDDGNATMAAHLAGIVKDWMDLAFMFRVEDEQSLDCLLHACAHKLTSDQSSAFGKVANGRTAHTLTHARTAAMDVLSKWGIVPTDWNHAVSGGEPL